MQIDSRNRTYGSSVHSMRGGSQLGYRPDVVVDLGVTLLSCVLAGIHLVGMAGEP